MSVPTRTVEQLIGWDILLTEEEKLVRSAVGRFVTDRCMPRIVDAFEEGRFLDELVAEMADLGVLGGNIEGYGCAGMGAAAYGLAMMELERCDSGLRSFASVQTSLSMYAIHRFGSEEQKQRWLPEMAAGRAIGCFGLTEPDRGSDPGHMLTRCRRDGDEWVLTGSKMWITNAQVADISVVWAREAEGGPESITGFLVERGAEGFGPLDIPYKLSMRASHTGGLTLDEVRLPDSARLPHVRGLRGPLSCLNNARFGVAWGVLGAARACLDVAIEYVGERQQFGAPIGKKQLVQVQLADMTAAVVQASLLSLHYSRLKDAGRLHPAQVSILKRNNCRVALDCARKARGLLGANGITGDHHVMRHAMNLESTYTYEGTDEIHSLIIGRTLTGLDAF